MGFVRDLACASDLSRVAGGGIRIGVCHRQVNDNTGPVEGVAFGLSRRLLVAAVLVSAAAFRLVKDPCLDGGAVTWRDFWQFAAISSPVRPSTTSL